MSITSNDIDAFFDGYATALLARGETTIAGLYAVPGLILFPGQATAVTDPAQTAAFFRSSWHQYDGVDTAEPTVALLASGPHRESHGYGRNHRQRHLA